MKLRINRKELISTKGKNLNLSMQAYQMAAEEKAKLDEIIIETITTSALSNLNDKQQKNLLNKENI